MKTTNEKIKEYLENLSNNELFNLWNDYAEENYTDEVISYFDEEFFETFFSGPYEAARATFFGGIRNWGDTYIMFNGHGNLESFSIPSEYLNLSDFADYIENNPGDYKKIISEI